MKYVEFLIGIILLNFICFANTIDVTKPYSNDSIIFNTSHIDTIIFSNGIKLFSTEFISGTLESSQNLIGIGIINFLEAGFKYVPDAVYDSITSTSEFFALNTYKDSLYYYCNNDTDWINAENFPDSLIPLDQITNGYEYFDSVKYFPGKWIIQRDATMSTVYPIYTSPLEGYKIIFYIYTINNKMKIQISNLTFKEKYNPPGAERELESFKLKWATDSLGNGKFNITTAILYNEKPDCTKSSNNSSVPVLFNLLGKKADKNKYSKLPLGHYIQFYKNDNKTDNKIIIER